MITVIYGPSGSGKTYSTRNIDDNCLYIDVLNKGTVLTYSIVAKAIEETTCDTVIVDNCGILIYDELNTRSGEKGFDKYNDIAGSFYKLLKYATTKDKHIILLMPWQIDSFGFETISAGGMLISEKLPISIMANNIYKTTVSEKQHVISTKNTGNDLVKNGLNIEADFIDSDIMIIVNLARQGKQTESPKQAPAPTTNQRTNNVVKETPVQTTNTTRERRVRR